MRLELGTFPVKEVKFGSRTRWADGVLEIDGREVMALAKADPHVKRVDVDLALPGERVRIVNMHDIVEPKLKVEGPGVCYPGICDRPVTLVGQGRTHRLEGFVVTECVDMRKLNLNLNKATLPRTEFRRTEYNWIDMSGPGAVTPYASLRHLVLTFDPPDGMSIEDWDPIVHSATLRVCDYLADKVRALEPPQLEVFDTAPASGLRGAVWVGNLSSMEITLGPYTRMGTGVYGITRCSAPWLLSFTEVMDGAVSPHTTYPLANNPLVMHLARSHGKELNFLGCIIQMTNWSSQPEKQAVANRVAYTAKALGAEGAVVTTNVRGQRMVETILGVQALERAGVKAVFMTEEEDNEDGTAPPLLTYTPEVVAVVSNGTGGVDAAFPPVDRVLGFLEAPGEWFAARQPIHGRYGVSHLYDFYGFGTQSCIDY